MSCSSGVCCWPRMPAFQEEVLGWINWCQKQELAGTMETFLGTHSGSACPCLKSCTFSWSSHMEHLLGARYSLTAQPRATSYWIWAAGGYHQLQPSQVSFSQHTEQSSSGKGSLANSRCKWLTLATPLFIISSTGCNALSHIHYRGQLWELWDVPRTHNDTP